MRALRSLMVGDCDHYLSPYMFGVAQAMPRLGHLHSQVSIRQPIEVIRQRIQDVKPDVIWTHMLLWAPIGSPSTTQLIQLMQEAARQGAKVLIHDGDYKVAARYPNDLSSWCSLALCNHTFDRKVWRVPAIRWPYFAFTQDKIAPVNPRLACDVFFAGTLAGGDIYGNRTQLVQAIQRMPGIKMRMPSPAEGNTLLRTAEIASSSGSVLGFGRPGSSGWVDTRVFQYPGAGAILLHDDATEFLQPWMHYVPYKSGNVQSVIEVVERVKSMFEGERRAMRESAFRFVQEKHSSVARVKQVLEILFEKRAL